MDRLDLSLVPPRRSHRRRLLCRVTSALVALGALGTLGSGCLDRPVAPQQPSTAKVSLQRYRSTGVDKIDLLFMIDNSASMADKQAILAAAVPDLVNKLTNPDCVSKDGKNRQAAAIGADCPSGFEREFSPVDDMHIGIITSSLGGSGSDSCPTGTGGNARMNDAGHLINRDSSFNPSVPTYQDKGYLAWDPDGKYGGEQNVSTLNGNFAEMVRGAGQDGCGFEASLEAWYRFLVDPQPYATVKQDDKDPSLRVVEGVDQTVLQQRKDFLRDDSLLAIIMLSDENDCSVAVGGQSYYPLQTMSGSGPWRMWSGTPECKDDPWSPSCVPCPAAPGKCTQNNGFLTADQDALNLRCWEQKRRFGIDYLHPIARYVNALTSPRLPDGTLNPAFCIQTKDDSRKDCKVSPRDPSLVFLAGIVGVPWQDIARDPRDLSQGYRTAEELAWTQADYQSNQQTPPRGIDNNTTLWNVILGETVTKQGDPNQYSIVPTVPPLDPLMRESVDPRGGVNPVTGDALKGQAEATSQGPNPINGFEWTITNRDDLQYACIFQLPTPITCEENQASCDCTDPAIAKPLCTPGSTTQVAAKAYPGRRQLAALKGVGLQGIVASICPAKINPSEASAPDWGYRPAIAAIVDRLKVALAGTCWDEPLSVDATGQVPCIVLEAQAEGACNCSRAGRAEPKAETTAGLKANADFKALNLGCACVLEQLTGDALNSCKATGESTTPGWCYVDETGNPALVEACPPGKKQFIQFVGDAPIKNAEYFLQCKGATVE